MVDSPAYRLNHEEVIKALEEGIAFAENLNPIEAVPDERGACSAMIFKREGQEAGRASRTVTLPARTVLVAAGTSPNITYEKEAPDTFQLDAKKKFFQPHSGRRERRRPVPARRPIADGFFTSLRRRRPVRHLLRRQPSALRRQRRQGDGVGQGRLPPRDGALRTRARVAGSRDAGTRDAAWAGSLPGSTTSSSPRSNR